MTLATQPTLAGFTDFVRNQMGIDTTVLPDDSPAIETAYDVALLIVNEAINCAIPQIYVLAVYNLGGDNLINFAPDQAGQTYFADLRSKWDILDFVAGVVTASSDEGTSQTLATPEALKELTIANLQNVKTPWGRQYLAFAQSYGPTVWGLT